MPSTDPDSEQAPLRGDIVRVRFDPIAGSEQGGDRPALVMSPAFINERAPVILVAPITSKKTERVYPFEALIEPPDGGLTGRSKALLLHVRGIDKARITGRYGSVSEATMQRAERALQIAAGLIEV